MKTKKASISKLKNRYTGEIVLCNDVNEITESDNYSFIRVFKEEFPQRTYFVNKAAYELTK